MNTQFIHLQPQRGSEKEWKREGGLTVRKSKGMRQNLNEWWGGGEGETEKKWRGGEAAYQLSEGNRELSALLDSVSLNDSS